MTNVLFFPAGSGERGSLLSGVTMDLTRIALNVSLNFSNTTLKKGVFIWKTERAGALLPAPIVTNTSVRRRHCDLQTSPDISIS